MTILAMLGIGAIALHLRYPGVIDEVGNPTALAAAIITIVVILTSALPPRIFDVSKIVARGGAWAAFAAIVLSLYAFRDETTTLADRVLRDPPPTIALASAPGEVELQRTFDGHFRAVAEIGDAQVGLLLDTGASIVLLRYDDAVRIGLDVRRLTYSTPVTTANGRTKVAPVRLESIRIGDVEVRNVRAAVAEKGKLHTGLLGMSFLGELEEVSIRRDRLTLRN